MFENEFKLFHHKQDKLIQSSEAPSLWHIISNFYSIQKYLFYHLAPLPPYKIVV